MTDEPKPELPPELVQEELTAAERYQPGPHVSEPLAATLMVRLGMMTPEEADAHFAGHQGIADMILGPDRTPQLSLAGQISHADLTTGNLADTARHIGQLVSNHQLDPAAARVALYAMQVALSATRLQCPKERKSCLEQNAQQLNRARKESPKPPGGRGRKKSSESAKQTDSMKPSHEPSPNATPATPETADS